MNFLKNKLLTIVLVLCLAFTIFIGISANKGENTGIFQEVVTTVVGPIQKYVYTAGQRISSMFHYVTSLGTIRGENEDLKKEVDALNKKLVEYDQYKRQNEDLKAMINFKNSNPSHNLLGAKVIGKVGDNWFSTIIIDRGSNDGVKKGQCVITGTGYVGKVKEVSGNTSKVMTFIDEKANIPVKISSTDEQGVISGALSSSNDKKAKVRYIPPDSKVKVGDKILTSNVVANDNELPQENIIVGTVTKVEEEESNFIKLAYVKPVVNFSTLENVMVIVK
ncbi:rod shape-determining protein MreC [Clostridium cylindrosporum]|uniref:Cell shape-determining protein MreC n=1 Tax=Clostridium cylindrosporum DSM 605 TaxID=1121307 RepID=A0A0J8DB82_CLOCY|nr:rod shape-determining protein MreC [Clostridium cylindrosporum]KMT21538.1 cell shape-determining protein MreC [Clostridium cylindrosporum DSM 605]